MEKQVQADLCKQIIEFDKAIRFVGIADRFGHIVTSEHRKGTFPLLSREESALSAMQSAIRMGSRKTMQPTLGKIVYSFTVYEKVKRATVPLSDHSLMLVSFDRRAEHESIISKKILPLVKRRGLIK
jgi:hypothetical protein